VSRILHRLANYEGGVVPATTDADHHDDEQVPVDDVPPDDSKTGCCGKGNAKPAKKPKTGSKSVGYFIAKIHFEVRVTTKLSLLYHEQNDCNQQFD
jgi:hypothetical protein